MKRSTVIVLSIIPLGLFWACASDGGKSSAPSASTSQPPRQAEVDDEGHIKPRRDDIRDIMIAKLDHARAIVEGVVLSDFEQVSTNASELQALSRQGRWMIRDTVTYVALSDEFRAVCGNLAAHAKQRDHDMLISDYSQLIHTCVACHTYLRQERQRKDMPGKVSRAE